MADLLVDGGAHVLGKALVIQRRCDAAHVAGHAGDDVVNLLGAHALTDIGGHLVQAGHVDNCASLDALNLLGIFYDAVRRHLVALAGVLFNRAIHCLVALLILAAAAAPTRVVSSNLHLNPLIR